MPRVNRSDILATGEIQVFHVVNRCVRRTHLCGRDSDSKKDYSHRKEWIRRRLEFLAGVFAAFAHPFRPLCPPLCPPVVSETFLTFSQSLERRKT